MSNVFSFCAYAVNFELINLFSNVFFLTLNMIFVSLSFFTPKHNIYNLRAHSAELALTMWCHK